MRPADEMIARGVAYLQSAQQADGSFVTEYSNTLKPFKAKQVTTTTFMPALMLGTLSRVPGSEAVRRSLAAWLLAQKSDMWAFNYWPAGAPERQMRPYPDDLDDTCCALAGLHLYDKTLVGGACLAHVVRLLVAAEQDTGGPYRTWLVPKRAHVAWRGIDLAVNANIAYFLRLVAEPLPKLTAMMDRAILSGTFTSVFYPSPHIVAYFVARAYAGRHRPKLADYFLRRQRSGHWGTPLSTALAVSVLGQLNVDGGKQAMHYLAKQQLPDGSWPPEALWLDEARGGQKKYAGSAALTTAFVLEALAGANTPNQPQTRYQQAGQPAVYQNVIQRAQEVLRPLRNPLCRQSLAMLEHIERGDNSQEVVLLPHMVAQSLMQPAVISEQALANLGLANLFGWMAYTIYDDLLDDEGDPHLLPVANVAMRESLEHFYIALPEHTAFQRLVRDTFNRIDTANAWEGAHCRFRVDGDVIEMATMPPHQTMLQLAERSLGHTLTPVGVLASRGHSLQDPNVVLLQKGLRHYLAARQLNDDLHDWQQDLRKGRITYVVAHILQGLKTSAGRHNVKVLLPRMERHFWHHGVVPLCKKAQRQIALSRRAFRQCGLLQPDNPLTKLLDNLDSSMARTLEQQANAAQFLAAYRDKQDKKAKPTA